MKWRKRLLAGTAVIVALALTCTVALLYRPVPYRFLEGAKLKKVVIGISELPSGEVINTTIKVYEWDEPPDSVLAAAQRELTAADGWVWSRHPEDHPRVISAERTASQEWANLGQFETPDLPASKQASASVCDRTTFQDRILALFYRQR